MNELLTKTRDALEARGFQAVITSTREEAIDTVLDMLQDVKEIACGGSVTIRDLGIAEKKQAEGTTIWWHWMPAADNRTIFLRSLDADVYLASANAVTTDGLIVNIDGTGNRVGAMAYGPKKVILVVGKNKLVEGGIQQAVARIKQEACPANAKRLNLRTPCALEGKCNVAACKKGMCNVTEILEHPTGGHSITVVLIDDEIGY